MPPKKTKSLRKKRELGIKYRENLQRKLCAEKLEKRRAKDRHENMPEERLRKKREANRHENMSEERLEKKHEADRHENMSKERLKKKHEADSHENMSEERLKKKHEADRHENMSEERLKKKHEANRHENMSEVRLRKKREANRHENMSEERLEKKHEADRQENMSEERLRKKHEADKHENMPKDRLEKRLLVNRIKNMTSKRIEKKRASDRNDNMSQERIKINRITARSKLHPTEEAVEEKNACLAAGREIARTENILFQQQSLSEKVMHAEPPAPQVSAELSSEERMEERSSSKLHAMERPSEDAIARLAARREKARMAHRLFQQQLQRTKVINEEMGIACSVGPSSKKHVEENWIQNQFFQQHLQLEKALHEEKKILDLAGPSSEKRAENRWIKNVHREICDKDKKQNQILANTIKLDKYRKKRCSASTLEKSLDDIIVKKHTMSRKLVQFPVEVDDCFIQEIEQIEELENVNKHNKILKKRKCQVKLAGDITIGAYLNVETYKMGELNVKCSYCGAVRFPEQRGRSVHTCCQNGQIMLPPLNEYPSELEYLLKSDCEEAKYFREHIRVYNTSFAFVTFGAHIDDVPGRGAPLIKIQGQVYHHATTSLANVNDNSPRNGQIYIYEDVEKAAKMRLELDHPNLTICLENLLRNINPYAQKYKMLHEMTKSGEDNYILNFIKYEFDDKRRYNKPTSSEVAMIILSKDGCVPCADLKVYPKQDDGRETTILSQTSQHADPMTFPLLFPHGDLGWSYNMLTDKRKKITPMQYYGYRLALRPDGQFNPLLHAGRLTQQYMINCYVMVERQRLDFIRHNQQTLRMECYQGIVDHVVNSSLNEANQVRLGTAVILPATYIGSPRCLQQLYQDSMAICRKIGRPDFFITMTCNPRWPEIRNTLEKYFVKGTTANDIAMIVTDVFQTKVNELIHDLVEKQIFGPIVSYVYTIEFQKRGLPHAHILAALRSDCKLLEPKQVDRFITAELSDQDISLRSYQLRHMLHGPHSNNLLCWNKEKQECSKKFPKRFCVETDMTNGGFPEYRRRDNTDKLYAYPKKLEGKIHYVDNRMVVPHNPYLLKKFDCHLNVEYCSTEMALKYIYKYIHKGHDRARMELKKNEANEVEKYIDSRYIGPMEAAWRLNSIPLHNRSHTVIRLPVHLDGQQYVTFEEGHEQNVLNKDYKTMLLGWFELNKKEQSARSILYSNIPEKFVWNTKEKKWTYRKRAAKVIGRIVNVSPKDSERFFLKLILNRISGATCYKDLRTYQGIVYETYREAAIAMGITENSDEANAVLEEAATTMMARQFRRFFVYYLIGDEPSNVLHLWKKFQDQMTERGETSYNALCEIEAQLNAENRTCSDFGLPKPAFFTFPVHSMDVDHVKICQNQEKMLNADQLSVYRRIMDCVSGISENCAQCFFIDGPGGTGKTFLYNVIYHRLLTMKKKPACIAWTGIASILLPCGTTSHRFFNLPIHLEEESICFLKPRDKLRLQEVEVVIWDEASMIPRKALETINRTLCDIMNNNSPFGGKTFILGGDFRQTLPVVRKASRRQIVDECIKSSYLWKIFEIHHLKINMRVKDMSEIFSDWLLSIGNGELTELSVDKSSDLHCSDLINWYFEDVKNVRRDLLSRIILSPQNDEVNKMNEIILSRIPGKYFISCSIDKATLFGIDKSDAREEEATLRYSDEYLNSLTPPGMPPHKLKLKVGCIIMLIRNLCVTDGLCNGTRLIVQRVSSRVLTAKIITGDKKDFVADIPRIQLNTSGGHSHLPFVLYRRQFPVRLAYALTINKSQGQSFERVGIYVDRPLFSHGQLYVALSRCVSGKNIKIVIKNGKKIENIVYKEVL